VARKPVELDGYPDKLAALAPFGPFRAAVTHVTDGDTVDVIVDQAFNDYGYMSIRVAGIDAPELFSGDEAGRLRGLEARDHLERLLADRGRHCIVASEKWPRSFGRYVGSITLADGTDLAEAMVAAGHAEWSQR
jgi:micrococcal nuclease